MFKYNSDQWTKRIINEYSARVNYHVYLIHNGNPYEVLTEIHRNMEEVQKCKKIIIRAGYEAPYYSLWFAVTKLLKSIGFSKDNILIIDMGAPPPEEVIDWKHVGLPIIVTTDALKEEVVREKDKIFISLARVPRAYRVLFTVELLELDLFLNDKSIISCGSASEMDIHDLTAIWKKYVPEKHRIHFPKIINTPVNRTEGFDKKDNSYFSRALINVIQETGFDDGYHIQLQSEHDAKHNDYLPETCCHSLNFKAWNRLTFTEKTLKCFLMRQLPLFLSSAGYVEYVRSLGFDVFDDFINHSYDTQQDPYLRIKMVAKELQRLYKLLEGTNSQTDYSVHVPNFHERTEKNLRIIDEIQEKYYHLENRLIDEFLLSE